MARLPACLVLSTTADGFLIENVAVLPELRSRGIGRALLIRAEQEARTRGHGSLYLYTNEKMVENIAMYERNGYVEYARQEGQGFSPGLSAQAARNDRLTASPRSHARLDILSPGPTSRRSRDEWQRRAPHG